MEKENKRTTLMGKYEIGRLLGKGNFAKVYYARNLKTSQAVAIKVIEKEKVLKAGLTEQIKREISVMKLAKHPNIVLLNEVMATKSNIFFVLEYARGGELFGKVAKGQLKEEVVRNYFQQLISAVDFCHSRGVFHRDLKPENILLDENGSLKVSDFGLSAFAESKRQDGLLHTTCGTPAYVAPEVICRKGYDGAKADIWSCGVILFALLAGYLPFQEANLMEMYRRIGKGEFKCPAWFPSDVRRLLLRVLDPNPNSRISIARIMEHPWFKKGLNDKRISNRESIVDKDIIVVKEETNNFTNLNAFDIISLSAGFDLSGLFEDSDKKREARFTSSKPASIILSKLEEIATRCKMKIRKRDQGVMKMECSKAGRKGVLSVDAEIFEFAPSFHLVEIKKSNGDTMEYQRMWNQDIRPALKDIVWAWQGEQQKQSIQS